MEIWEATTTITSNPYSMTLFAIGLVALGYVWGKGWHRICRPRRRDW